MEEMNDKDFIATLRKHGLQVTYQRLAIYQTLYFTKDHPSAESIYQQVKKRFPMISLGTVYKTLERFYEVGLIQKVSPMTDVARYDALVTPHHHMVCLKCQAIEDVKGLPSVENIPLPKENGFRVLRQQIIFQGYCPHCQKGS
ncbi:transcriptional repressor [Desulforhabdus amnigena]|jgi:Fur family peroxide stress response transcriptional regulator|uniref:Transcriptional repressor n=2 Tax=Desulforhabdus amnigena TaxID=40218 RepID=A0A9W6D467_9BACT|nr:transcriptional repressor [Desulforhabdus amnigena]